MRARNSLSSLAFLTCSGDLSVSDSLKSIIVMCWSFIWVHLETFRDCTCGEGLKRLITSCFAAVVLVSRHNIEALQSESKMIGGSRFMKLTSVAVGIWSDIISLEAVGLDSLPNSMSSNRCCSFQSISVTEHCFPDFFGLDLRWFFFSRALLSSNSLIFSAQALWKTGNESFIQRIH